MKTYLILAALGAATFASSPVHAAEPEPSAPAGHYEWRAPAQPGGPRAQPVAPARIWVSDQAAEMAKIAPAAGPVTPVKPGEAACDCAMMRGSAEKAAACMRPDAPK